MISTQHHTHFNKTRGILGQRTLKPHKGDNIPHSGTSFNELTHLDTIVGWFISPVVCDAADDVGGDTHLGGWL